MPEVTTIKHKDSSVSVDKLYARGGSFPSFSEAERAQYTEDIQAESRIQADSENPEVCFRLGWCWYRVPTQGAMEEAVLWLRRSIELQADHSPAHLYLGYCLFDLGHYSEAKEHFELVPKETFAHVEAEVVAQELVLCCDLYSHPYRVSTVRVTDVLDRFRQIYLDESAWPTHLISAISSFACRPLALPEAEETFRRVLSAMKTMNLGHWFPTELETIATALLSAQTEQTAEDE